jgi:hypothetical protein
VRHVTDQSDKPPHPGDCGAKEPADPDVDLQVLSQRREIAAPARVLRRRFRSGDPGPVALGGAGSISLCLRLV